MIVSINQPAYLPWLGYFDRIAASDIHVVLDNVQFEKNSFSNRNRIRTADSSCWLTVPLRTKGRFGELRLRDVEIADRSWAVRHRKTLDANYRRAPFYAELAPPLHALLEHSWDRLAPLCAAVTSWLLGELGITTPVVSASDLGAIGAKDELVLALCRELGATTYLSGALGRNYLREDLFTDAGIAVAYQAYEHPEYTQAFPGFVPNLAAVDLLFNHGSDSLGILRTTEVGA